MKKLNVIMLLVILLLTANISLHASSEKSPPTLNEGIEFENATGGYNEPRSTIEQIVKGTIYNQSVLTLTISINDILNVKILDEFGSLLYTGTYSPSNPSAITVDVSSWDSGKYEVTLRKVSNEPFLSGEFTIN